jgi:hypothetical protein
LKQEDEAVADNEAVVKGEGPLAPGEDGTTPDTKDNVHRPDEV